jgi:hypothetical protein
MWMRRHGRLGARGLVVTGAWFRRIGRRETFMNRLPIPLAEFQSTCKVIEAKTLEFLLQYRPCEGMTVGDVKTISHFVRDVAFSTFDAILTKSIKE